MKDLSRRSFLSTMVGTVAGGLAERMTFREAMAQPLDKLAENVPRIVLGRTGWETPIIGTGLIYFGAQDDNGNWMTAKESDYLLETVIDSGINFFESAVVYRDAEDRFGSVLGRLSNSKRQKLFVSAKSLKASKQGILNDINASLAKFKTDYLDEYVCHDIATFMDYENIMKPDGAYEGLKQAQKEGKIRFIGMTSHSCPVSMYAVRSGLFDTHLIAYNIVGREFERSIQLAARKNAVILIMKPFGGDGTKKKGLMTYNPDIPGQLPITFTPEESLRFVLSTPGITLPVPGLRSVEYLKEALAICATFKPLTPKERNDLVTRGDRVAGGVCGECKEKPCENICPNHVPISYLLSELQLSFKLGYDRRRRSDQLGALLYDFMDCDGEECGLCEGVCPEKFDIIESMGTYEKKYREARYRARYLDRRNKI